jgi:hypothetical protein
LPNLPPASQTVVFPSSFHLGLSSRLANLLSLPLVPIRALQYPVLPSPGQEPIRCCRFRTKALKEARLLALDRELVSLDSNGASDSKAAKSGTRHSEEAHSTLSHCRPKHYPRETV